MIYASDIPNVETAKIVASSLLGEAVLEAQRLTTGGKNFVYAITTSNNQYVIRMTSEGYKSTYEAAIYWQNKLLPLGVPLAKFIATDLDRRFSPFPSLLMQRVPGDDICNVYKSLSTVTKQSLAQQLVSIHDKTRSLPLGSSYGFANSYEQPTKYKSWGDFLAARLDLCQQSLNKSTAFAKDTMTSILAIANDLQTDLLLVPPKPFMWDTSERNVLIHDEKIIALVDVDDMCFGDPLFVLGLTYVALESLGFDTIYTDSWATLLKLDHKAQLRLQFYRLFYTVWFMRHYADVTSDNGTLYNLDANILNNMFQQATLKIMRLQNE